MTFAHTPLQSEVAALLVEALNLDIAPETIDPEAPLYGEALALDSTDILEVALQGGREPLVTALARRVHGSLTPPMASYSRKVTLVWTGYFVAMAALSLALYAAAPFDVWAAFANLVTPIAIVVMFIGEYLL